MRLVLRSLSVVLTALLCGMPARAQADLQAVRGTGATAMLLDVRSGRVVAQVGDVDAQRAPGSSLKPFVLRAALQAHVIEPATKVHCAGTLRIDGRNLACVHPRDVTVLDARQALAESCNTYFAEVARRMSAQQLTAAFSASGLRADHAPRESTERELMALGLVNVRVSVASLAQAYRGLALWMESGDATGRVVRDGMLESVRSGAAHAAHVDGTTIAGKTGTVDVRGTGRSYGWFSGLVYGSDEQPQTVIVVFVPQGNGRDAAALARRVLVTR